MSYDSNNIFARILRGEIPCRKVDEDAHTLSFHDINPLAPTHVLVVPIAFTSDHGYFYGEHCLGPERRLAYEEAIRIPLLIRYPPAFPPGSRPENFALSVDMASTMLDLAGVSAPRTHGQSLRNPKRRDDFLIEYTSDTVFKRVHKMGYRAVRNSRWKYIAYSELKDANELNDLREDPFELHNLIETAKMQPTLKKLQSRLSELVAQTAPK